MQNEQGNTMSAMKNLQEQSMQMSQNQQIDDGESSAAMMQMG